MARPNDGYAFDKAELNAIWQINVDTSTIFEGLENRWEFLNRCATDPTNPYLDYDKRARDTLTKALLAEHENVDPIEPPAWPCLLDHSADEHIADGWMHASDADELC